MDFMPIAREKLFTRASLSRSRPPVATSGILCAGAGMRDPGQNSTNGGRGTVPADAEEAFMRFVITIGLIFVLSAVGLTYEIAAGRVLAPYFGTSLLTWTAVIATVLAGFSLGNALGGFVAERERSAAVGGVRTALVGAAVLMALSPTVLDLVHSWGARGTGGMLLSVVLAFFPASVLVSLPSPLKSQYERVAERKRSIFGLPEIVPHP